MQGIVTKVEAAPSGKSGAVATVRLSDFRNLKVTLLLLDLKPHLLPKKTNPKPKQDASVVDRFSRPSPSKRKKLPVKLPEGVPTYGPELQAFLATLRATTDSSTYPPGTRLWASFSGNVRWPCLAWSVRLCKLRDLGAVAISYRPGHILVLWYGEHSLTWVRPEQCDPSPADESVQLRSARAWSRSHNK